MKYYVGKNIQKPALNPNRIRGRKPRIYREWKSLKSWDKLPAWEESPVGYLLREAREESGTTQKELARKLGITQQAVSQAEKWDSNPTVTFIRLWLQALDLKLELLINPAG